MNTTGKEQIFHQKRWLEKIEKNNGTIALNFLYATKEKIYPAYFSKQAWCMGNRHGVYRGKDCIKKFCESLRERAMIKIITFNKKNMKLLTNE